MICWIPRSLVIGEQVNVMLFGQGRHFLCMFQAYRQRFLHHDMYAGWSKGFYDLEMIIDGSKGRNCFRFNLSKQLLRRIKNLICREIVLFSIPGSQLPIGFDNTHNFNILPGHTPKNPVDMRMSKANDGDF